MSINDWDGNLIININFFNLFIDLFFIIYAIILALRKQARHLENDIDLKLVAFSKIGAGSNSSSNNADTAPLLGEHVFDNLTVEIEQMLEKLSNLNEKMSELPATGAAMLHTLQRHREILHVCKLKI